MNFWELIKYFLLGAIQGLTEPLPISSSAHMGILAHIFGIKDNSLTFEILINFASFLAVGILLSKNIKSDFFNNNKINFSLITKLVISSIPLVITGLLLHNLLESSVNDMIGIAVSLLITSFILLLSFLIVDKAKNNNYTYINTLIMGFFQSLAVFPGITRSGTVLLGGLTAKLNLKETLKFSFYMYMVASLGSMVLKMPQLVSTIKTNTTPIIYYITAFISSFVFTMISFKWFIKVISKKSLLCFLIYTAALGLFILIYNFVF